jgi:hypothetical protein
MPSQGDHPLDRKGFPAGPLLSALFILTVSFDYLFNPIHAVSRQNPVLKARVVYHRRLV